jgi:hypothetical protein
MLFQQFSEFGDDVNVLQAGQAGYVGGKSLELIVRIGRSIKEKYVLITQTDQAATAAA